MNLILRYLKKRFYVAWGPLVFIFQNFVEDGCEDRRNVEKSETVPLFLKWLRLELWTRQFKWLFVSIWK